MYQYYTVCSALAPLWRAPKPWSRGGSWSESRLLLAGGARMDRRHWVLLLAALACIAGLVLWIGEIDLGMEETIAPPPASPASVPASR